jgi:hypothetical protein
MFICRCYNKIGTYDVSVIYNGWKKKGGRNDWLWNTKPSNELMQIMPLPKDHLNKFPW